jgi:hypothetical protein
VLLSVVSQKIVMSTEARLHRPAALFPAVVSLAVQDQGVVGGGDIVDRHVAAEVLAEVE